MFVDVGVDNVFEGEEVSIYTKSECHGGVQSDGRAVVDVRVCVPCCWCEY